MKAIDHLIESVRDDMSRVEESLRASAASEIDPLGDVCAYILDSGGKRFRPLILILAARFCRYSGNKHIALACALEFIHTATLLHDDVIDHAEMRRGNSSVNLLWGNQSTILAGDFFFSKAFSLAISVGDVRIMEVIARTCSCLTEAEIYQVAKTGDPMLSEEDYYYIVQNKTASLIAACTKSGGMLSKVSERQEQALEDYGFNLGIAFQIMDDVLDYTASEKEFGKTIGKDLQEGSVTLPFIAALNRSSSEDRDYLSRFFTTDTISEQDLSRVIELVEKYQGSEYAVDQAKKYAADAVKALDAFDESSQKQPLIDLAEYVVTRKT